MTTLSMVCRIVFPKVRSREEIIINRCSSIEFESTWKEIASRGFLTLPRNIKFFDKNKVSEVFRRGDPVIISFGYNNNLVEEFRGYITKVSADIPIRIEFEDEMFRVKTISVNLSAKNITLKDLLEKIAPGYKVDCLEGLQLGSVRLSKTQVGPVLDKLKQEWGIYTYMDGQTIVSGKYYALKSNEPVLRFHLERTCVSTSLNYQRKEDIKVRIKAVSTLRNGTKIEIDGIGDNDGNERQLTFYGIEIKGDLERLAMIEYRKYKVDRFDGSFTAFGHPSVNRGLKCELTSGLYPERSGTYYIEKVVKTFDNGGIRQNVTLGEKVS